MAKALVRGVHGVVVKQKVDPNLRSAKIVFASRFQQSKRIANGFFDVDGLVFVKMGICSIMLDFTMKKFASRIHGTFLLVLGDKTVRERVDQDTGQENKMSRTNSPKELEVCVRASF